MNAAITVIKWLLQCFLRRSRCLLWQLQDRPGAPRCAHIPSYPARSQRHTSLLHVNVSDSDIFLIAKRLGTRKINHCYARKSHTTFCGNFSARNYTNLYKIYQLCSTIFFTLFNVSKQTFQSCHFRGALSSSNDDSSFEFISQEKWFISERVH